MASRSIARTTVSFGLVSVPVAIHKATDDGNATELHQFDRETGSRIRYQKVRECDGQVVDSQNIVKGAEVGGQVVLITEADLSELAEFVPTARAMEVEAFVEGSEINPLSLSGVSYFIVPDSKVKGGGKAYRLLADAMRRSGRLAVTVWGLRGREHPFVIGVGPDGVMVAQQLHWPSQIRNAPEVEQVAVSCTEEDLADQLVNALAVDHLELAESDNYSDALAALVSRKAAGEIAAPIDCETKIAPAGDLTAMLLGSLEGLRGKDHKLETLADHGIKSGYTGVLMNPQRPTVNA